jgi:hypothetical protein
MLSYPTTQASSLRPNRAPTPAYCPARPPPRRRSHPQRLVHLRATVPPPPAPPDPNSGPRLVRLTPRPRSSPSPALSGEHLAGIPALHRPHPRRPHCMVRILSRDLSTNQGYICEPSNLSKGLFANINFTLLYVLAEAWKIHIKS